MELVKTKSINDLIDFYGVLLTKNQLNTLELYYQEDLSLGEIASELNISRSAVYDSLKRSVDLLKDYESKLKLVAREKSKIKLLKVIDNLDKETIKKEIEKL
ncbi:TPA: DNA-binding protein [bacterium]|jgi:predicted DNA-binding protein YlxM (UPF0122 family)|nr:DNA-binding protein [bacterium]